jgi:polyhydroxyalkanoate synthesis regulator phasin
MQNLELESKIQKLEDEIQKLKTELSIAIEFYAETRQFLNDLLHLAKTSEVKKQELDIFKPTSVLESVSSTQVSKPKSRIDQMMERCINLIFEDYKQQGQG